MNIRCVYLDHVTDDFVGLSMELDNELAEKNGALQEGYAQYNKLDGIEDVVLCLCDDQSVGCASMKCFDEDAYEVKRVFVRKEYRGGGISEMMMEKLEEVARSKGIKKLVLETGRAFIPAIGLYTKLAYGVIENYGQYKGMENSVCMMKTLAPLPSSEMIMP